MGISREALLDELTKIASDEEQSNKKGFGKALRAMGVAAGGGALGYGAAELLARKMDFFKTPTSGRASAARIILPILSGAAVTLADRYRSSLDREYGDVKGYEGK